MAKTPTPLDFNVSITFNEKVPLAKRKAIVTELTEALEHYIGEEEMLREIVGHVMVECQATSQQLEICDQS